MKKKKKAATTATTSVTRLGDFLKFLANKFSYISGQNI